MLYIFSRGTYVPAILGRCGEQPARCITAVQQKKCLSSPVGRIAVVRHTPQLGICPRVVNPSTGLEGVGEHRFVRLSSAAGYG